MNESHATTEPAVEQSPSPPRSIPKLQRRILGVLMEKARTTPDAYPLSLNGLVTGCNQKSNRHPLMDLSPEQVEDELIPMREGGIVAEVHGGGRVPKYRHYGYDYLGVKGVEAAILTELLLRGEQSAGDLRSRAGRFEPMPDLQQLLELLQQMIDRQLVIPLTPAGRGQIFTHNFYMPDELERLKNQYAGGGPAVDERASGSRSGSRGPTYSDPQPELQALREEVAALRSEVERLSDRLTKLEN